uniref:Uncharacterized protein n=1 Tax=Anguilla anguilla TaxID=7936 RepID=A0A0E9WHZ9_ANGAN
MKLRLREKGAVWAGSAVCGPLSHLSLSLCLSSWSKRRSLPLSPKTVLKPFMNLCDNAILKALCLVNSLCELVNGYLLQKDVTYMYLKKRIIKNIHDLRGEKKNYSASVFLTLIETCINLGIQPPSLLYSVCYSQ